MLMVTVALLHSSLRQSIPAGPRFTIMQRQWRMNHTRDVIVVVITFVDSSQRSVTSSTSRLYINTSSLTSKPIRFSHATSNILHSTTTCPWRQLTRAQPPSKCFWSAATASLSFQPLTVVLRPWWPVGLILSMGFPITLLQYINCTVVELGE